MRPCSKCKELKDELDFVVHNTTKQTINVCKLCDWKRKNTYDLKQGKAKHYLTAHGMTPQQYTQYLEKHGNKCDICGSTSRLHIDHSHVTGRTRGVLCSKCNHAIGLLDENIARMKQVIHYLERASKEIDLLALMNQLSNCKM